MVIDVEQKEVPKVSDPGINMVGSSFIFSVVFHHFSWQEKDFKVLRDHVDRQDVSTADAWLAVPGASRASGAKRPLEDASTVN